MLVATFGRFVAFSKRWNVSGGYGGVFRPGCWLACFLLAASILVADETLRHARQAESLLGPAVWRVVIRIENDATNGRYPRRLHALVFELSGTLWFYTSVNGTQSFSLHRDRLAAEKADFGPLLRDIDPGFVRWTMLGAAGGGARTPKRGALPNGCFIESVALWQARVSAGETLAEPQLLSYYVDMPAGRRGHTVLTYATARGVEVIDATTGETHAFPAALGADPIRFARALRGRDVARARWLPLELPSGLRETARMAGGAAADENAAAPQPAASVG